MSKSVLVITGVVGLVGAILTGIGEFVLHYDSLARFAVEYEFFSGISDQRSTIGHFFGVLGAPLYLVGCWHIRLMLQPASGHWSLAAFFVGAYGFVVGIVWIGSRSSISALVNAPESPEILHLIGLYDLRYETLLQLTRLSVLLLSIIYIWLTVGGRSLYPRWMAGFNPFLLIVASFVIYLISPEAGKYLMPIALNVAFAVFFALSIAIARKKEF